MAGASVQNNNYQTHILVISQFFYPEQFRINDICREWVKRGYKVTVVTGIPNYPQGKFYKGYSLFRGRKERWEGMDIIRLPLIPRGSTKLGMILNYFSFPFSGWWWNAFTGVRADMVFSFETSPMTQVKIGCRYAKKHCVPHFLYAQDLWPENVESITGIHNRLIIGPIDRMVDRIYKGTDRIFVTSPSFAESVVNRRVPVPRDKVFFWPQYAEEFYRSLDNMHPAEIPDSDDFKIAFTGNIGVAQGLEVLPRAAALLKDERVKFIIIGNGRDQKKFLESIAASGVSDKFILIDRQPAERIPELLSACDAGFISFNGDALWEKTIPAKLQSYMACGKAIVASASGETKRVIDEAKCGICCEIGDAHSLANGIQEMMRADTGAMGKRARAYFDVHFDKKMLMDRMSKMIGEVTSK